jgi:uncharacterized BrkB/YihY/UPF0761 family membrane protein
MSANMGALGSDGRITRFVSNARHRVDAAWAAVEARRPRVRSIDATFAAYERDRDRAGWLLAGAIAHRLFLWLLPFTLVLVAGLGFLESANHNSPSDLANSVGVVGIASKSVATAAADAEHARFIALFLGIPTLYLASVGALKAFRAVSALAWGVPIRPPRRTPLAVLGFFGVIVAFFVATFAATAVRNFSPALGVIVTISTGIVYVWLSYATLWVLPRPPVSWTALLPGALVIGFGVAAIHLITVYFVSYKISTSSETYGALGAAAAILLSLYLLGRLFVAGVMLNSTLWEQGRQAQHVSEPQSPIRDDASRAGGEEPLDRPCAGDVSER